MKHSHSNIQTSPDLEACRTHSPLERASLDYWHLPPGALFALANWTFLDAAILSAHAHPPYDDPQIPPPVHVQFVDWVPGICSLLGMLIINLIDIRGDDYGDSTAVWRAHHFLFIGFAFMAGGPAGSVSLLVLKYAMMDYPEQYTYYGYVNVSQNVALMLSVVVLWIAQSAHTEYDYILTLQPQMQLH
ncbi:hypothetical protein BD769DRAFT_1781434 [Suillus cothurnatus]|nr:hypothetical protein BD769DRAFT_1781434 [Suillus cothurnatus]